MKYAVLETNHYDNDFPTNFPIEVEMTNAKFKITPLALSSLQSLTSVSYTHLTLPTKRIV